VTLEHGLIIRQRACVAELCTGLCRQTPAGPQRPVRTL